MSAETASLEEALKALEKSSNRLDGLDIVREIIKSSPCLPQGMTKFAGSLFFFFFALSMYLLNRNCKSLSPAKA